jgi:hypothetical protein
MTQSCVTALARGTTINCGLCLDLIHLWVSEMHTLFITPYQGQEFSLHIARHQTCP